MSVLDDEVNDFYNSLFENIIIVIMLACSITLVLGAVYALTIKG